MKSVSRMPPLKQKGRPTGRRTLNGTVVDVRGAAEFFGASEKWVRSQVARHRLPFRRYRSRILFVKTELEEFVAALPVGCSLTDALQHQNLK